MDLALSSASIRRKRHESVMSLVMSSDPKRCPLDSSLSQTLFCGPTKRPDERSEARGRGDRLARWPPRARSIGPLRPRALASLGLLSSTIPKSARKRGWIVALGNGRNTCDLAHGFATARFHDDFMIRPPYTPKRGRCASAGNGPKCRRPGFCVRKCPHNSSKERVISRQRHTRKWNFANHKRGEHA